MTMAWDRLDLIRGMTRTALEAIERGMVRIRRSQTRRTLAKLAAADAGSFEESMAGVVDAIEEGPDVQGGDVTVGTVAERLGADPSRASRLVARAVQAGYVARVASQADGRRIRLELTPAGRELAEAGHRFRQSIFERLVRDWPESDREEFARLLTLFVDALSAETRRMPGRDQQPGSPG